MSEQWLPVVGYEGEYSVSDHGRVRSEFGIVVRTNGKPYTRQGKILRQTAHYRSGHMRVSLRRCGVQETASVHCLVLAAFVGPCPLGMESLHWDDVPSNNHLTNLRYGTRSENKLDQVRNGRHHNANATHCVNGHEFTTENTYQRGRPGGGRQCRRCQIDNSIQRRKTSA